MYNRYIPQDDGTYRKNQILEPQPRQSHMQPQSRIQSPTPETPPQPPVDTPCIMQEKSSAPPACRQNRSAASFLRQLLPKNMDTGDLLIVLLLLLMAGDSAEDNNTAILTLALYLLM